MFAIHYYDYYYFFKLLTLVFGNFKIPFVLVLLTSQNDKALTHYYQYNFNFYFH